MHTMLLAMMLTACGGDKTEAPKPAPVPAAPAPVVTPPPAAPPAPAAPAATGPYVPDDLAKAAYEKARAAGADKITVNPKAGDAAAIAAGKTQYEQKCVACHGATGMGDGVAGAALPQKPAEFHGMERWNATPVGVKHWVMLNGIQGTAMAPLGLTPDQAWETLAYVESGFVGK